MHRNSSGAGEWHPTNPRVTIDQPAHAVRLDTWTRCILGFRAARTGSLATAIGLDTHNGGEL